MEYAIEMLNITKEFPGIKANDDITLQVKKGEVHALLGENGAGKSTLMSILFGLYQPDMGEIKINGQSVKINDPNDANKYNIGINDTIIIIPVKKYITLYSFDFFTFNTPLLSAGSPTFSSN